MSHPSSQPGHRITSKRKAATWPAVAAAIALAATACTAAKAAQPPVSRGKASQVPAVSPRPLGASDTAFGLDVLSAWCRGQPAANIVFSPASLATGLGLAYLGARGQTAAAMARVLHLPVTGGTALISGLHARQVALGRLDRPGVTLAASNRVWADPSFPARRSYLNAAATGYGAGLWRAPLQSDPEKARQLINATISRETQGHIPALLPPGSVNGDAWVLTDALYLDADWATPFTPSLTKPGPFATASGGSVTPQYMHGGGYRFATADGWTAVSLPYRGGALAMTALLPPAGAGCRTPAAVTLGRVTSKLASELASQADATTGIALPRVNLSSRAEMNGLLASLGMGIALRPGADFTGLSPKAGNISVVEHAATLQVGEKGTVATAATAVGVTPALAITAPAREIVFDRPYLMLVTDTATGEPLFLARVANPAAS